MNVNIDFRSSTLSNFARGISTASAASGNTSPSTGTGIKKATMNGESICAVQFGFFLQNIHCRDAPQERDPDSVRRVGGGDDQVSKNVKSNPFSQKLLLYNLFIYMWCNT